MTNLYQNKKVILSKYPSGKAKKENFCIAEEEISDIKDNEMLVKSKFLGVDAALRLLIRDSDEFLFRVKENDILHGNIVGEVIESKNLNYDVGDYIVGSLGIQKYAVTDGSGVEKINTDYAEPKYWLGGMGIPGLTAYYALLDVCKPTAEKHVLITGAAGAVGSMAGQIAKICGSKVFGTTSSNEKCKWLVNELGYDYAFNYNDSGWLQNLKDASNGRLDIIFDNSGGDVMNESLKLIGMNGIVLLCGSTSQYFEDEMKGPSNYIWLGTMRASLQGFVIFDYESRYDEARINLANWFKDNKIKMPNHIIESSIESFPSAFEDLFDGKNLGKMMLQLND